MGLTLSQILDKIGERCEECAEFGMTSPFVDAIRKDGKAVLLCRSFHEFEFPIEVELTAEDKTKLQTQINNYLATMPDKAAGRFASTNFLMNGESLMRQLTTYAHLMPIDRKETFEGFCQYCYRPSQLIVEKSRLWVGCSDCAMVVADSAD